MTVYENDFDLQHPCTHGTRTPNPYPFTQMYAHTVRSGAASSGGIIHLEDEKVSRVTVTANCAVRWDYFTPVVAAMPDLQVNILNTFVLKLNYRSVYFLDGFSLVLFIY